MNEKLLSELGELKPLYCQEDFVAYLAAAKDIPYILSVLGYLREKTFRDVGEGTGNSCDLDRFDEDYHHLFLWHKKDQQIVGAYRVGLTDHLFQTKGHDAIYLESQYDIHPKFFQSIYPALELGRAFIAKAYQRNPLALTSLWRALGKFIGQHPQYIALYGVISISKHYQPKIRQWIVNFLLQHKFNSELSKLLQAKNPFTVLPKSLPINTMHALDIHISQTDPQTDGLPPLFHLYDSFGLKYCGFSIDPDFNEVLDCLGVSFITQMPTRKLRYFMGEENILHYFHYHGIMPKSTIF